MSPTQKGSTSRKGRISNNETDGILKKSLLEKSLKETNKKRANDHKKFLQYAKIIQKINIKEMGPEEINLLVKTLQDRLERDLKLDIFSFPQDAKKDIESLIMNQKMKWYREQWEKFRFADEFTNLEKKITSDKLIIDESRERLLKDMNEHKTYLIKREEELPGGLGDLQPISKYDKGELKKGIDFEKEHHASLMGEKGDKVAKEIAKDNLEFDPEFYEKMEETQETINDQKEEIEKLKKEARKYAQDLEIPYEKAYKLLYDQMYGEEEE